MAGREIKYIVIHCTATDQSAKVESIQRYWREVLKWRNPGYHWVILPNGSLRILQDISKPTNGVAGYNANSIHISYIGGLHGDDRTEAQRKAMYELVKKLMKDFPKANVRGHRDFPGVSKSCPNFDVKTWLKEVNLI